MLTKYFADVLFKPFVRQWLENRYGYPVIFPPQSIENTIIRRFSRPRPADLPAVPAPVGGSKRGATRVGIPDSKAKPAATYNYLGRHAQAALAEVVEDGLNICIYNEVGGMEGTGCPLMKAIYSWCECHAVSIDYADTIRQRYYRMRQHRQQRWNER